MHGRPILKLAPTPTHEIAICDVSQTSQGPAARSDAGQWTSQGRIGEHLQHGLLIQVVQQHALEVDASIGDAGIPATRGTS